MIQYAIWYLLINSLLFCACVKAVGGTVKLRMKDTDIPDWLQVIAYFVSIWLITPILVMYLLKYILKALRIL